MVTARAARVRKTLRGFILILIKVFRRFLETIPEVGTAKPATNPKHSR
jgi:hypothetical protein